MRVLRFWRFGIGAATLAGALGAGAALAQPVPTYPECSKKPTREDNELAKNAHKLAASYYERADYDSALQHWNEALKFDCSVNDLLINIANAYEKKGDKAATIATLEAYLKRTGPNPILEEKVKNLKAAMVPPTPTVTAAPTVAPTATAAPTVTATPTASPPPPEGPRPFGTTPWYLVGGGGAVAIAGVILLGVGYSAYSSASNNPACTMVRGNYICPADVASQGTTGRNEGFAGWALLGAGIAAAGGGLVWQFGFNKPGALGSAPASNKTGVRNVWVSATGQPGHGGVMVGGSF